MDSSWTLAVDRGHGRGMVDVKEGRGWGGGGGVGECVGYTTSTRKVRAPLSSGGSQVGLAIADFECCQPCGQQLSHKFYTLMRDKTSDTGPSPPVTKQLQL